MLESPGFDAPKISGGSDFWDTTAGLMAWEEMFAPASITAKNGLIFEASELQFGAACSLAASGHSWQGGADLTCVSTISVVDLGVDLAISVSASKTGNSYSAGGIGVALTTGTLPSSTSIDVRVTYADVRVYVRGGVSLDIFMEWGGVTVDVNGTTVASFGAGDKASVGIGPQYVPLFGVAPKLQATAQAGAQTGGTMPPTFDDEAEVTNTVSGGWRFKEVGSASWVSLPVSPWSDLTVPTGSGAPFNLSAGGIVTTTETWGAHLVAYSYDRWARTATTCPGPAGTGENETELRNGAVWLMPDLTRSFERIEAADFAALIYRGGFPEVTVNRIRNWGKTPPVIPPPVQTAGGPSVALPALGEEDFVALSGAHALETEVMPVTNYAPVLIAASRSFGTTPGADPCDDFPLVFSDSESVAVEFPYRVQSGLSSPVDAQSSNGDMLAYLDHRGSKLARHNAFWGNPHWSFGYKQSPWELSGSPTDWADYWGPIRTQWLDLAGLPVGDKRQTRNSIITDVLDDGELAGWQDTLTGGLRWWGVSRWDTVTFTPRTSYTYDSGDSALFSGPPGSLVLGANISFTPPVSPGSFELDLGSWQHGPYMWPHIATHVTLDWTAAAHVTNVALFVEGVDGQRRLVAHGAALKGIRQIIPRGPDADEYAGSWGIDNGFGVIADTGSDVPSGGVSAATMGSAERASAFQLLPGDTREKLVIEVTVSGAAPVVINYPVLEHLPPLDPVVVNESGQCAAVIWGRTVAGGGGNGIRFGNLDHYAPGSGWRATPLVEGAGYKSTVVDGLAFGAAFIEGNDRTVRVPDILDDLYDGLEVATIPANDRQCYAVVLPALGTGAFRMAAINTPREVPPLGCLPRRRRDAVWLETLGWEQRAYSWVQEPRRFAAPGPVGLRIFEPSPSVVEWTTVEGGSPPGWTITRHNRKVTNSEAINYRVFHDGTHYANVRPWWGWFGVFGLPNDAGGNISYDVSWGGEHYRAFVASGTAWFSVADNALAWTDFDTGFAAEWVAVQVMRGRIDRRLSLIVADGGEIKQRFSTDQGATWTMATTLSSGTDNKTPAQVVSPDGTQFIYWVKGSDPFSVYGTILDKGGNVVAATFAVSGVGNVDDAGIAVHDKNGAAGERLIVLQAVQGGAVVQYTSTDGRSFV